MIGIPEVTCAFRVTVRVIAAAPVGFGTDEVPVIVHMDAVKCGAVYRATTKTECGFEVREVFFGPFHFLPNGVRRVAHANTLTAMKKQAPKQITKEGMEIPIPKRNDVLKVFRKAAKPLPRRGGPKK